MGANGSGKSTLVRALLGLVPLSAGRTELYGMPPAKFRDWKRVGYVPQRLSIGGGVPATVREIVASGRIARQSRLRPSSAADRLAVDHALRAVGMADRARDPAQELSGGQQQRVLIARALAGGPDALVMDEPTAGVDARSQETLAGTLGELVGQGRTVVLVAHELGPLEPLITARSSWRRAGSCTRVSPRCPRATARGPATTTYTRTRRPRSLTCCHDRTPLVRLPAPGPDRRGARRRRRPRGRHVHRPAAPRAARRRHRPHRAHRRRPRPADTQPPPRSWR
jgi:ABC-type Mn/Zn transport systems, ATPase component